MKKNSGFQQQGDVLIKKIDAIPEGFEETSGVVLADGEATGHAHRVKGNAKLLKLGDRLIMQVLGGDVSVVHEEHHEQKVAPGIYEISRVREYDHFLEEARKVKD